MYNPTLIAIIILIIIIVIIINIIKKIIIIIIIIIITMCMEMYREYHQLLFFTAPAITSYYLH